MMSAEGDEADRSDSSAAVIPLKLFACNPSWGIWLTRSPPYFQSTYLIESRQLSCRAGQRSAPVPRCRSRCPSSPERRPGRQEGSARSTSRLCRTPLSSSVWSRFLRSLHGRSNPGGWTMPRIERRATKKAKESLGPWPKKGVARPARGSERYVHPGITTKGDAEAQESRVLTIACKEQSALARLNQVNIRCSTHPPSYSGASLRLPANLRSLSCG